MVYAMGIDDLTLNTKLLILGGIIFIIILIAITIGFLYIGGFFQSKSSLLPSENQYYDNPTPISFVLNGSFINDTIPTNMTPGKSYIINIIAHNTGDAQWSKGNHILLAIAEPNSYDTALFNNTTIQMEPKKTVTNGTNYTWKVMLTAPQYLGNYTLSYQMKNDTDYWFGDILTKTVSVGQPNDSVLFVSPGVLYYPSIGTSLSMKSGKRQNVSIAVKNMCNYNWSTADNIYLAAVDYEPNDAGKFYPQTAFYIAPDGVIHPGEQCFWRMNLTAPYSPGTYYMKYRMQKDGQWFGNTLNVTVRVS